MALSPDDIVNHEFKQSLRGYAVAEVDDLLDRLADQVERTDRELDDLRQRLRENEARLASALETESSIKRTLVTAQDAAERALQDAREQADELRSACEREVTDQLERAHQEAERVVVAAQQRAATELDTARSERDVLEGRIDELRSIERTHRDQLRTYLQGQLAALDELEPVPPPLDPAPSAVDGPADQEHAGRADDADPADPTWSSSPQGDHDRVAGDAVGATHDDTTTDPAPSTGGLGGWLDALEESGAERPSPPHERDEPVEPAGSDPADDVRDRWFTKPVDDVGTPDGPDGAGGRPAP